MQIGISQMIVITAVLALSLGTARAQTFQNVVIGEGCASICVDGRCEKTCKSSSASGEQTSRVASPEPMTMPISLQGFSGVITNNVDVQLQAGKDWALSVSGTPSCLKALEYDLVKGVSSMKSLRLGLGAGCDSVSTLKLTAVMPSLRSIRAYGNADVVISGFTEAQMNLEASDNVTITLLSNRFDVLTLKTDGNADVASQKSEIFSSDVMLSERSDVKLRFPMGRETGLITGVVAGMSELLYCGSAKDTTKVLNMADVSRTDCQTLSRFD